MWSRSVLRVAQVMAVATMLLVSTAACGSTDKSLTARVVAAQRDRNARLSDPKCATA